MIITFYDRNLEITDNITQWKSLYFANTYNSMGAFSLELNGNLGADILRKLWQYCTINYDNENVYVITSINIVGNNVVLTGFPATYIFSKRVSTSVIKKTNAEQAMKNLVDNMTPWDNLVSGNLKGLTDTFQNQISDKQIIEYLQGIGQSTDMGFKVTKKDKKLVFESYKPPLNTAVKYSTSLKNVADADYLVNHNDFYNVAIVAGAGEGSNRITVTAMIGNPAGADRRELYVDARNEQIGENETSDDYKERLKQIGLQKLAEHLGVENLSFFVANDEEVKLGDIVTVSLDEYSIVFQSRVTEEEVMNEKNTTTRTISVGKPINVRRI